MNPSDYAMNRLAKDYVRARLAEARSDALAREAQKLQVLGIAARPAGLLEALSRLTRHLRGREQPCPTC